MESTQLFYVWLALLVLAQVVYGFVLGGIYPGGKPLLPADESPDITANVLSFLSLPQLFIPLWLLPLFTAPTLRQIDPLVIFGTLLAMIMFVLGIIRYFRRGQDVKFQSPRQQFLKAFTAATAATTIFLLANWIFKEKSVATTSVLIESTFKVRGSSGVEFTLPVRSPFPWKNPSAGTCELAPDQVARVRLGTDRVTVNYSKGGVGLPLIVSCALEN